MFSICIQKKKRKITIFKTAPMDDSSLLENKPKDHETSRSSCKSKRLIKTTGLWLMNVTMEPGLTV